MIDIKETINEIESWLNATDGIETEIVVNISENLVKNVADIGSNIGQKVLIFAKNADGVSN